MEITKTKISVIGAGGWGTTIADLLGGKGYKVKLWAYEKEVVYEIENKRENPQFLPGIKLSQNIEATNNLKEAVEDKDVIFTAVPSAFLRNTAKQIAKYVGRHTIIVSLTKGLEELTFKRMSEILEDELGKGNKEGYRSNKDGRIKDDRLGNNKTDRKEDNRIENSRAEFTDRAELPDRVCSKAALNELNDIAVLSGPNHAEEVSRRIPTATVIASKNLSILPEIKKILETPYFKVYTHDDAIGIEICGAMKNITAIAVGVCDGLGMGDNTKASIITLGLTEMSRVGKFFGAKRATFYGLGGVGDLIATCTSKHSRNRFIGERIAEGKSSEEIKKEMHGMVAEGIKTAKSVYELSRKEGISLPLTTQVYKVLYEKKELKNAIRDLITLI